MSNIALPIIRIKIFIFNTPTLEIDSFACCSLPNIWGAEIKHQRINQKMILFQCCGAGADHFLDFGAGAARISFLNISQFQTKGRLGNWLFSVSQNTGTGVTSVAEPHNFYVAPAPGKNFDAAPAAPAPILLYSKAKFLKWTHAETMLSYDSVRFVLVKIWTEWVMNCYILFDFSIPNYV
jgi:hypothetical protein